MSNRSSTPGRSSTRSPTTPTSSSQPSYPLPAYLNFTPGGLSYKKTSHDSQHPSPHHIHLSSITDPTSLINKALTCDSSLHSPSHPTKCYPSLSSLSHAAFSPLTGVPPSQSPKWASSLLGISPETLKKLPTPSKKQNIPCGYIFRRGDIAWNCRTCQTDSTCVQCDTCFHQSSHEGHDVFFHRTSPGGCCDCGDPEAWAVGGCCPEHRPLEGGAEEDDLEAVRSCERGRVAGVEAVRCLGEYAGRIGVVVGAVVGCVVKAVDGGGIGCDYDQWRLRWAEQCCMILSGCSEMEEFATRKENVENRYKVPTDFLDGDVDDVLGFPKGFKLHLRLHNDDVHTFEEVIEALHEPMSISRDGSVTGTVCLVPKKGDADSMTHHVDSDGQVTVKTCNNFKAAKQGFERLKSKGIHCAVVSSPQEDMELRATALLHWLRELAALHPGVNALITHALVDITDGEERLGDVSVWTEERMIPYWIADINRFDSFPPHLTSSYLTRYEARILHAKTCASQDGVNNTGIDKQFYSHSPFTVPSPKLRKSPHALWGTMPFPASPSSLTQKERLFVVDTDLRKQQEADKLTSSLRPYELTGLHRISGIGLIPAVPTIESVSPLLGSSSFIAPFSPIINLLLLDPYPPKNLRRELHSLFLSLLIDPRFKSRFAAALGSIAYRPLSTLFCAGVGTESDTILGFTVQIFTAGSLVRALNSPSAAASLLGTDSPQLNSKYSSRSTFVLPLSLTIARSIHTNLLGSTKEVTMVVKNTAPSDPMARFPSLTYRPGENLCTTPLPAAPDDGFLDSRSTRHKRLPHLLRDLEYVFETPGTSLRLLSEENEVDFCAVWTRLLRLAQGMDSQKRKISGGHVEYEQARWLEAFGLSLNFAGTRDALTECPIDSDLNVMRKGMGNLYIATLREIKLWLYREGLLETGFPMPNTSEGQMRQLEANQRSTLHWNKTNGNFALSCATGVKMTEMQLSLIEFALRAEEVDFQEKATPGSMRGAIMGDWLRVPHSPLMGDWLSFHLPLHRSLARSVRSLCGIVVPASERDKDPKGWWKLPVLDDAGTSGEGIVMSHPLTQLMRPTLQTSNCRVVWSSGPDCSPSEAQERKTRSCVISSAIAMAKVAHSLCDHPLRCLTAAQQIERHLWARNGSVVAGMSFNYGTTPLCRSFRDLDLTLVQLSSAGFSIGLGARRTFALLINRYSMDGYLCDPVKRGGGNSAIASNSVSSNGGWVNPPRMQDPEHAVALAEAFFTTVCLLVSELPSPPPLSRDDNSSIERSMRRELLHALAAEPRSHSEALTAASLSTSRREESESFRSVFSSVLKNISRDKYQNQSSRAGPPTFELKMECSDEYDPTFFHLRRNEHQHAMDCVARLRQKKIGNGGDKCLALVIPPPLAHPRFLPCRLILHLPMMDAAIRRALLFALTGGEWLPPSKPTPIPDLAASNSGEMFTEPHNGNPNLTTKSFGNRQFRRSASSSFNKGSTSDKAPSPFGPNIVAQSSISFLEVLQVLTLQVHTLEECACLHATMELDEESRQLSAGLSINSYLTRMMFVPPSLEDAWALSYPGPLPSKGTGTHRGSVLGLLIALFEHRNDHHGGGAPKGEDESGGARSLAADGLKWVLRFISSLVDGAPSVKSACESATSGVPVRNSPDTTTSWSIAQPVKVAIKGMLSDLPNLWPKADKTAVTGGLSAEDKSRAARKAAQLRAMERMKKQQANFAAAMSALDGPKSMDLEDDLEDDDDEEKSLCIICRCDDADGDNNGPLGFLGHVQRSKLLQLRNMGEIGWDSGLQSIARVVGDKGCQLRETEDMASKPIACLPTGSIVKIVQSKVSSKYDLLSRRVKVTHSNPNTNCITEGWASVQSSQGYIILSPLANLCYNNTRWGATRPLIKQCGHAAHLGCVDAHCLSLHQRAAGDQPYDGRFAANIEDGEFLCPLCKQLSNVLIPKGWCSTNVTRLLKSSSPTEHSETTNSIEKSHFNNVSRLGEIMVKGMQISNEESSLLDNKLNSAAAKLEKEREATRRFGAHLLQAMQKVSWERTGAQDETKRWNPLLKKWDYEDETDSNLVGSLLRLLRQQHIAWGSVGYGAATAEASVRGVNTNENGTKTIIADPWVGFDSTSRDSHPMLLELRRSMNATTSLMDLFNYEMISRAEQKNWNKDGVAVIGHLLSDILEGHSLNERLGTSEWNEQWRVLMSLLAAMPCHVARDGSFPQRHEARATAAAMWAVKGSGSSVSLPSTNAEANVIEPHSPSTELPTSPGVRLHSQEKNPPALEIGPPTPLSVKSTCSAGDGFVCMNDGINGTEIFSRPPKLSSGWGTLDPFQVYNEKNKGDLPFRPAVASAFLYIPLLSWDLNTLAGAVFSSMLLNQGQIQVDDLALAARVLLTGRLVQVLITPQGMLHRDVDEIDDNTHWEANEYKKEEQSLSELRSHCLGLINGDTPESNHPEHKLLRNVGLAILPFARALILILRASRSTLRQYQRHQNRGKKTSSDKPTPGERAMESLVENEDVMTLDDGFQILKMMGGPMPSQLFSDEIFCSNESTNWLKLIDRWVKAVVGLESYHGSRGKGMIFDVTSNTWIPSYIAGKKKAGNSSSLATKTVPWIMVNGKDDAIDSKLPASPTVPTENDVNGFFNASVEVVTGGMSGSVVHSGDEDMVTDEEEGGNNGMDMEDINEDAPPPGQNILDLRAMYSYDDSDEAVDDLEMDEVEDDDDDSDEALDNQFEFRIARRFATTSGTTAELQNVRNVSEEVSSVISENDNLNDDDIISNELDLTYAEVSQSSIIPYQPSLLGKEDIGPGPRGVQFEFATANSIMCDLSHLGMIHRPCVQSPGLIRLPRSFVELYSLVNKVKGREGAGTFYENDDGSSSETAICLLTGAIMRSGSFRRNFPRTNRPPGVCTWHSRKVGSGIGIFFLVQKCTVLLIHNNKSAYSASLYVDEHGEEDPGLRRGRPLILNEPRYQTLETLWQQNGIPREVAQIRSTSDRVIRDNWY